MSITEWPTGERLAEIVANIARETGYGPTREELREFFGAQSTRNLPGVQEAQRLGLIRYDEDGRLVPC